MDRTQRNGLLLVLLSAVGYSFFSILTKSLYKNGLPSAQDILTWRFLIATPLIWALLKVLDKRRPAPSTSAPAPAAPPIPRLKLMVSGVLFALVALAAFSALGQVPVSLYTVLLYTYPAMVAIGSLAFGERLSALGWVALGLTLVGAAMTVPSIFGGVGDVALSGILLVFTNASLYALYILFSSRILRGQRDLARASAWSISGSFVFVLVMTLFRGLALPATPVAWFDLVALAVVATVIPIFAFYAGIQMLGAARASIVSTVEPVMTLLWATLLLGESLLPLQIVGAACILLSVILLQVKRPPRPTIRPD
jgi:drug/metabolite transporter (DMT)-like permease